MKNAFLLVSFLVLHFVSFGQNLEERIASGSCSCLEDMEGQVLTDEILRNCVSETMARVLKDAAPEEQKVLANVKGIQKTFRAVYELLPKSCELLRLSVLKEKREKYYRFSSSEKANRYFGEGNMLMETGDYPKAIKKFKKALKADDQFVYALDHLAVSYRMMNDMEKAIQYYKRSLSIYPEGDLALLNIAVAYSFQEDYQESLKHYQALRFYYPENPEGYFGIAKISFILEDYEQAVHNIFLAHKMYVLEGSEYVNDSKQLIGMMYRKLNELNQTDLFISKAEEHGIEVNLED